MMEKSLKKFSTMIIGLIVSAVVYFSLWSIFKYFEIIN